MYSGTSLCLTLPICWATGSSQDRYLASIEMLQTRFEVIQVESPLSETLGNRDSGVFWVWGYLHRHIAYIYIEHLYSKNQKFKMFWILKYIWSRAIQIGHTRCIAPSRPLHFCTSVILVATLFVDLRGNHKLFNLDQNQNLWTSLPVEQLLHILCSITQFNTRNFTWKQKYKKEEYFWV